MEFNSGFKGLNPESISRYDGLHDAGRCHTEYICQKTTNHCGFILFYLLA